MLLSSMRVTLRACWSGSFIVKNIIWKVAKLFSVLLLIFEGGLENFWTVLGSHVEGSSKAKVP